MHSVYGLPYGTSTNGLPAGGSVALRFKVPTVSVRHLTVGYLRNLGPWAWASGNAALSGGMTDLRRLGAFSCRPVILDNALDLRADLLSGHPAVPAVGVGWLGVPDAPFGYDDELSAHVTSDYP